MQGQSQPCTEPLRSQWRQSSRRRPPNSSTTGWTVSHGTFTAHDAWVRAMVAVAYGVHAAQVHGGPALVDTEQYDVIAKAGSMDVSLDQMRPMLRTLLVERFKLVVHHEIQEGPIYALIVGKSGSKMREARDTEKTYVSAVGTGHLVCKRMNMLGLVITLSNTLGTPVIDKTGLTGSMISRWNGETPCLGQRTAARSLSMLLPIYSQLFKTSSDSSWKPERPLWKVLSLTTSKRPLKIRRTLYGDFRLSEPRVEIGPL
jgi:uncharacterized protein (TIGR03435 family)